jgi:hypothetical protein
MPMISPSTTAVTRRMVASRGRVSTSPFTSGARSAEPPEARRVAHWMKLRARDGTSTSKMCSTSRLPQRSQSFGAASAGGPASDARKAALIAPAETPVMRGNRSPGKWRAMQRSTPA